VSDLTERLRQQIAYDVWNMGEKEESVARDALARIDELEDQLMRTCKPCLDKADRIEELEAALRWLARDSYPTLSFDEVLSIARRAQEKET